MFTRAALLLLLGALMCASSTSLRGPEEIKATPEQTARGARMVRNLLSASSTESERRTLQAEQASVAFAAHQRISPVNWTSTQSKESHLAMSHLHDYVAEGWSLIKTNSKDCSGPVQNVMGFKLGECTDLYSSHMWVSYMQICDRTGHGQYSDVSTATYLGRGCSGVALGTSTVDWGLVGGDLCTHPTPTHEAHSTQCSEDTAFMNTQQGVTSSIYANQHCAGAPGTFHVQHLGACAKATDIEHEDGDVGDGGGLDLDDAPLTLALNAPTYGYIRLSACASRSLSYEVYSDAQCTSKQFQSTFPLDPILGPPCQAAGEGSFQVECS
ncbi:hypothetical protein B484DRAFT_422126 [Ochromonadaceae sp. CCMP2298]|nr:hypothetical protein B484DRAFT_422126 [Ochromonadaceae sp. CCMP2298]